MCGRAPSTATATEAPAPPCKDFEKDCPKGMDYISCVSYTPPHV